MRRLILLSLCLLLSLAASGQDVSKQSEWSLNHWTHREVPTKKDF